MMVQIAKFVLILKLTLATAVFATTSYFEKVVEQSSSPLWPTIAIINSPKSQSIIDTAYSDLNLRLKPKEVVYFSIPEYLWERHLNYIILGHHQKLNDSKGGKRKGSKDHLPGFLSVQIFSHEYNEWLYWGGPSSFRYGSKFAHVSNYMELDNIYSWQEKGAISIKSQKKYFKDIKARVVRVVNTGKDIVYLRHLEVKTIPTTEDKEEVIFSPGTAFGDLINSTPPKYGGGQRLRGLFPQALKLEYKGRGGAGARKLPYGWELKDGNLQIPLQKEKKFNSIALSLGDSYPDQIKNEDGGWGTKGRAKISIAIIREKGKMIEWLVEKENIPPQGIITVGNKLSYRWREGDKIEIRGYSDPIYIMGIKLNYTSFE